MSKYCWLIEYDYLDEKEVSIIGPSNASERMILDVKKKAGTKFKLHDDDGELYYTGYITGDFEGFEPLDDYGMPNAGCTNICYQCEKTGKWESIG